MHQLKLSWKLYINFVVLLVTSSCAGLYKGDSCLSNVGAKSAVCVNIGTGVERIVPWEETMNWFMVPQEDTASLLRACRLKQSEVNLILKAFEQGYSKNEEISNGSRN